MITELFNALLIEELIEASVPLEKNKFALANKSTHLEDNSPSASNLNGFEKALPS